MDLFKKSVGGKECCQGLTHTPPNPLVGLVQLTKYDNQQLRSHMFDDQHLVFTCLHAHILPASYAYGVSL